MSQNTVTYVDHMGSDLSIVNDARISFSKISRPIAHQAISIPYTHRDLSTKLAADIPTLSKYDIGLIKFLARGCTSGDWDGAVHTGAIEENPSVIHDLLQWAKRMPTHWTPFGHQIMKFRMKAPVPIRTQCFKHKIGMVENEESRRYIKSVPEIFIPEYRLAPEGDIKQGSGGPHPDNEYWQQLYKDSTNQGVGLYLRQIEAGIAPEQARFSLPQGAIVNWAWTGSLYAFAEFYNQRSDRNSAQQEVADLADKIGTVAKALFPVAWSALTE